MIMSIYTIQRVLRFYVGMGQNYMSSLERSIVRLTKTKELVILYTYYKVFLDSTLECQSAVDNVDKFALQVVT